MTTPSLPTKPHYPILDGLRGVAAFTVVAFHIMEAHSTSHLDQIINHGYLAVDFFFLLSGFVIGYAYDDRWNKLTNGGFFKRRLVRLQPMVVMGMIVGAVCFYFQASALWPMIATISVWRMLLVMLIGFTLIPVPTSMDIRGWHEMHPLNGPGWSLFFEYVANILYGLFVRKFSKSALTILVIIAGVVLVQYAVTSKTGDIIGGWSLDPDQLQIGFTRVMFPFFAGLLLSRTIKTANIKNAFFWSSLLLLLVLAIPRIGGAQHLWVNGLYDSLSIIIMFPLIVYIGASGNFKHTSSAKLCKFFGDISYPIYITHYPLIYIYTAWVAAHHVVSRGADIFYGVLTFMSAVVMAYLLLKFYDEPVRRWLTKRMQIGKPTIA